MMKKKSAKSKSRKKASRKKKSTSVDRSPYKSAALELRAIQETFLASGDKDLSKQLQDLGKIVSFEAGDYLTKQGQTDDTVFVILMGCVDIIINGQHVDSRTAGHLVGEMEILHPLVGKRLADVRASEDCIALTLTGEAFYDLTSSRNGLWERIALDFCERLQHRTSTTRLPNTVPLLFIGSASESLSIAQEIQSRIDDEAIDVEIKVWTEIFQAGKYPIDDLLEIVERADFALFILSADDVVRSRGAESAMPRDNVIFETGMLMGGIGRMRTYVLVPNTSSKSRKMKIWSDLLGLTQLRYHIPKSGDRNITAGSLTSVCRKLRERIEKLGIR